jgi:hypothetical protein
MDPENKTSQELGTSHSSQIHPIPASAEYDYLRPQEWTAAGEDAADSSEKLYGAYQPVDEEARQTPEVNIRRAHGEYHPVDWQPALGHTPAVSPTRTKRLLRTLLDYLQTVWRKAKDESQHLIDFLQDSWVLEIGACVTALLLFIVEIVLLRGFEKHQIGTWPWSWSLNSAVALITTFIEANLVFAITSCLGQMKWLWFSINQGEMKRLIWIDLIARSNTPLGALSLLLRPTTWR